MQALKITLALTLITQTAFAAPSSDNPLLAKAERYTKSMIQQTVEIDRLQNHLKDDDGIYRISEALRLVLVVQLAYWGGRFGKAVTKTNPTGEAASNAYASMWSFITIPAGVIGGLAVAEKFADMSYLKMDLQQQKFLDNYLPQDSVDLKQASANFENIDRNIRSLRSHQIFAADSLIRRDLQQYRSKLFDLLRESLENHPETMAAVHARIQKLLDSKDPENYHYAIRVFFLGADQIEFQQAVQIGMLARNLVHLKFISLNQNLIAEIRSIDSILEGQ